MSPEPELNKVEVWIAEHSIRILAALGLLIVVGGFFVARAVIEAGETSKKVTRIEPQVTRVNKAICDKQSLDHLQRAERCAERIRVGLINCRRSEPCRAAFLAIATYPPPAKPTSTPSSSTTAPSSKGVVPQQPSNHGHQQPGPGSSPGHHGGQGAPPAASPGPPPAAPGPAAPGGGPPAETPGNGAQGAPGGSSSSGAGVEVCALERTCVKAEVGLGN